MFNRFRRSFVLAPVGAASAPHGAAAAPERISYGADPAQILVVFQPATPGPHKLVLWVHGGGWVAGGPGGTHQIAAPLTAAGYTVVGVGYRLVPHTDVAGSTADVAHAAAYVLNHAGQFDIDPSRFALIGHSAGSTLVALLGTDPSYLHAAGVAPGKLAAVITLDGVFDVSANLTHFPHSARPEVYGTDPADWGRYSPVAHLGDAPAPPTFCVVHEDTVPRFVEQAQLFEAALKAHHDPIESLTVPGLTHGELVKLFRDPSQPMGAFAVACLKKAL
jgi:acetyl esterase/lipase